MPTRLTVYGVSRSGKSAYLAAVRAAFPGGFEPPEGKDDPDREQWMVDTGSDTLHAWIVARGAVPAAEGHGATLAGEVSRPVVAGQGRGLAVMLPAPVAGAEDPEPAATPVVVRGPAGVGKSRIIAELGFMLPLTAEPSSADAGAPEHVLVAAGRDEVAAALARVAVIAGHLGLAAAIDTDAPCMTVDLALLPTATPEAAP